MNFSKRKRYSWAGLSHEQKKKKAAIELRKIRQVVLDLSGSEQVEADRRMKLLKKIKLSR